MVQVLTVSHNRALPHWYRHSHYHTTEHCHIGTALTVSHNRALPHWYRHSHYHTAKHCHIGAGNHSITKQNFPVFRNYTLFTLICMGISSDLMSSLITFVALGPNSPQSTRDNGCSPTSNVDLLFVSKYMSIAL